jgi:hypothetical protein
MRAIPTQLGRLYETLLAQSRTRSLATVRIAGGGCGIDGVSAAIPVWTEEIGGVFCRS